MPAGSGPDFHVRLPTAGAGTYHVEVVGRGVRGDTVIANFPVYVGTAIPTSVRVGAVDTSGTDVEAVRRQLLALINQTRREAGLSDVTVHGELRNVAATHSRDMIDSDFIGHTSPSTGSPSDRVRAGNVRTGLVLENIGRGYSAQEIHRGLMGSPGHRANIVNPDVTHVGIGVVAEAEGARHAFVVTQMFVRLAERVDLTGASEQIVAMVNRARAARGAPPANPEDHLNQAAQAAADAYFADPSVSQQDVVDDAVASVRRFRIMYRRLGGMLTIVQDVSEAGSREPTLDPEIRHMGVGVAQGTRPDVGDNAIAVVFVWGWPR